MTQRQPRVENPAYLAYIRSLPCLACGKRGPSDAAHLRSSALRYGKRHTGMGEKPDDRWTLPLCRRCHEAQHSMNELGWWAGQGIADPFAVAKRLYENCPVVTKPRERTTASARPKRKQRPIPAHKDPWPAKGSRKIPQRIA